MQLKVKLRSYIKIKAPRATLQALALSHFSVSEDGPAQAAGPVQVRVLVLLPDPQVTEQSDQLFQVLQKPAQVYYYFI